jgi:hypothetical protein
VAGPLSGGPQDDALLRVARLQDAAAWATIAVALVLAPWERLWRTLELPPPAPAWAFAAAGALLAALAVAHGAGRLGGGGRRAVAAGLAADVAAALALAIWLLGADPASGTLGTVVLAVTAASLALQAAFDAAMLAGARR